MIFQKHAPFSKQVDLLMQPGCRIHFGQFGEDILLPVVFGNKPNGFYVDIGCHDPFTYSNTYLLHSQLGWKGINIDASPISIERFKVHRPKDINLNVGVSTRKTRLEFHMFKDGAVNTFDKDVALRQSKQFGEFSTLSVDVLPLSDILDTHLKSDHIDYMNIDCEWLDHEVVLSNDWNKFRPDYLTVELHGVDAGNAQQNETVRFLFDAGYRLHSLILATGLFQRTR